MTQREVLERLQRDCETMQIHGGECFATQLIALAASFYTEMDIKNECFGYLNARGELEQFYESREDVERV
ncbi:MAG: hypothetical protein R3Y68_06315 [Rikenellaceae bacterium]